MRVLTSKNGGVISHFDETGECEPEKINTSLNNLLVNNHDIAANEGMKEKEKDNYH